MLFSTRGRYALRVMLDLAEHADGSRISLREIAARQEISQKYLESIMTVLAKADFVSSQQGKKGGYQLTRKPADYTVYDILNLTDGPLSSVGCLTGGQSDCPRAELCPTLPLWSELDEVICSFLSSKTLADLMQPDDHDQNQQQLPLQ